MPEYEDHSVYGTTLRPRLKWKCRHCTQRNDHKVPVPPSETEVFVCRKCKRASTLTFKLKQPEATAP